MDLIEYMIRDNAADVNRIRAEANAASPPRTLTREEEIELAWQRMKAGRGNT